jgi:hypothetical protein
VELTVSCGADLSSIELVQYVVVASFPPLAVEDSFFVYHTCVASSAPHESQPPDQAILSAHLAQVIGSGVTLHTSLCGRCLRVCPKLGKADSELDLE